MLKKTKFIRKNKTITNLETKETKQFEFVNAAKRESVKIQLKEDGALGRGSLSKDSGR